MLTKIRIIIKIVKVTSKYLIKRLKQFLSAIIVPVLTILSIIILCIVNKIVSFIFKLNLTSETMIAITVIEFIALGFSVVIYCFIDEFKKGSKEKK